MPIPTLPPHFLQCVFIENRYNFTTAQSFTDNVDITVLQTKPLISRRRNTSFPFSISLAHKKDVFRFIDIKVSEIPPSLFRVNVRFLICADFVNCVFLFVAFGALTIRRFVFI